MKFFHKKKNSSTDLLSPEQSEALTLKDCLDYFSSQGGVEKTIIDGQRYTIKKIGKDINGLTSHELDIHFNKELINERAIRKYEVEDKTFHLNEAGWFPRLRTIKIDEDTESISSDNSDLLEEDGFMGPFSWETRSVQEMSFPETPEIERKTFENTLNLRNISKKDKKRSLVETNDHRSYETLEELRTRLVKNYKEAKIQREKYLKNEKTQEAIAEKSVNGRRNKNIHQDVHKNYKRGKLQDSTTDVPASNGTNALTRTNSTKDRLQVEVKSPSMSTSDSFAMELSSAIMKHSSSSGSSLQTSTSRSDSTHSMKSELEIVSKTDTGITLSNGDDTFVVTSSDLTRKNSSKKKRSTSRSGSLRRKNSQRNKTASPPVNNNDTSLVMKNSHGSGDNIELTKLSNDENTTADLSNMMDMLSNW